MEKTKIRLKRAYEAAEASDGFRVLVDRLWPRGVSKEKAKIGLWAKDVAPSSALRTWFGHDPKKWHEFNRRYRSELDADKENIGLFIKTISKSPIVTFIYGAKDTEHTHAIVLRDYIESFKVA